MRFIGDLSVDRYNDYLNHFPMKNFMQTIGMAEVRKTTGWDYCLTGVEDDQGNLIGAGLLSFRNMHFGQKLFYAPRGLAIDYRNKELLSFYTVALKKYIHSKKGYILRIDPYIEDRLRDIDGNPVENGFDNSEIENDLISAGFFKADNIFQETNKEFVLPLDKDYKSISSKYHSLTKRMIKRGKENLVQVEFVDGDDIKTVHDIIASTGEVKGFSTRGADYFYAMKQYLKDDVKFVLARLDLNAFKSNLQEDIAKMNTQLSSLKNPAKIEEINVKIEKANKKLAEAENYQTDEKGMVNLSGDVFINNGDEFIFLFGGNVRDYIALGGSYVLHDEMIRYAIEQGYKKYNFYGCPQISMDDGVYAFKRGFNGHVEQLIGDYILVCGPYYYLEKLIHKVRK